MSKSGINKVVLAYSGGLDTSIIVKWLQDVYQCEVVTFTADIGQDEEVEPARAKAQAAGIREIYIEDLREEFARDYVFPMFRANAIYEGEYLLGTSIARPLIAKRLVEIAKETGADAISHGATGKGNDQVRFELGAYALAPDIKVIAPWREWDLLSREKLMQYAESQGIEIDYVKQGKKSPYSMDANLLHISYEGDILEDPWNEPRRTCGSWTVSARKGPGRADLPGSELREGRHRRHRRQGHEPGRGHGVPEPGRWRERCGTRRYRREPLCRHEVARLLRDAGRHRDAEGAPRHGVIDPGP